MKSFKIIVFVLFVLSFLSLGVYAADSGNSKTVKKKIAMLKDDDSELFNGFTAYIQSLFEKRGYTTENSEFIIFSMKGNMDNAKNIVKEITKTHPDLIIMNSTMSRVVAYPLMGSGVPVLMGGSIEITDDKGRSLFLDSNGMPKDNVVGTYTMPKTYQADAFKLLNKICPIKDKKAVFITMPDSGFLKKDIEKALKDPELKITLKEYKETNYFDDYKAFVKKYDADPEVAWVLIGQIPVAKKDGKPSTRDEVYKWERENKKKPEVAFWQTNVEDSSLCGIAIDTNSTILQLMDMSERVLKGEKVKQIKPEEPQTALILLNQARAKTLNVSFPFEVLKSAWRVYTDFDGHYEGQK